MKLLFDEDLIESALARWAGGKWPDPSPLLIRRFHAERERCYHVLDPDDRNAAFLRVHQSWFHECGLLPRLENCVRQFPILSLRLESLAFRQARTKSDESADLYVNPDHQHQGVVALRPERLDQPNTLDPWLHHELLHLSDMLDPHFAYEPHLDPLGMSPTEQRCLRERYRLLWNITIDGRLAQRQLPSISNQTTRRAEFDRAFAFVPGDRRQSLFHLLWSDKLTRHPKLLELASDPHALASNPGPTPGAHCPLCGFPTFEWADSEKLASSAINRIQFDFKQWRPTHGLCARCAEIYTSAFGLELPPTICHV